MCLVDQILLSLSLFVSYAYQHTCRPPPNTPPVGCGRAKPWRFTEGSFQLGTKWYCCVTLPEKMHTASTMLNQPTTNKCVQRDPSKQWHLRRYPGPLFTKDKHHYCHIFFNKQMNFSDYPSKILHRDIVMIKVCCKLCLPGRINVPGFTMPRLIGSAAVCLTILSPNMFSKQLPPWSVQLQELLVCSFLNSLWLYSVLPLLKTPRKGPAG